VRIWVQNPQLAQASTTSPVPPATSLPVAASMDDVLAQGLLSYEALARARLVARESGERLHSVVTRLGLVPEQRLAAEVARRASLELAAADRFPAEPVIAEGLSAAFLRDSQALPLRRQGNRLTIAVADPFDDYLPRAVRFATGLDVTLAVACASDIEAAVDRLHGAQSDTPEDEALADDDDLERMRDLVSDAPVIRAVNRLIAEAVDARASDIHLEPADDRLGVRYRIDGVLRPMPALPAAVRGPIVSRIKVMAGLNIAERRLPQDGRLRLAVRGHEIDLRVATSPSIHGESVVLRILDRTRLALDFPSLGFDAPMEKALRAAIGRPHGIVLVTGPTGSGKTTTLYAALAALNSPDRKLLTVEDPIEYRLPGIVQAQAHPQIGFSFATALRSFLRQDPDVIMVGEIRDTETAEIAVQAALTGHLILATLHTNSAAGAVTRLLDMKVEPFLLGSVLSGVLAQRLVRRLCPECRVPVAPDPAAIESLSPGAAVPDRLYAPSGCAACGGSGYAGRLALLEFLPVDAAVSALIVARADERRIAEAATGGRTLAEDGLAKAALGLTSLEEVLRVENAD
jgi:general secretion pathway protein E